MHVAEFKGVVFDVDETLLDTNVQDPINGLHELARLQAVHEVGQHRGIPELVKVTPEQNLEAFHGAALHSLEGSIQHLLFMVGLADSEALDPTNPLLLEIAQRKDELFVEVLRQKGKPIEGAVEFVDWLAAQGLKNRMAIASTASRSDLDIFLEELTDLKKHFPDKRIIAKDNVSHVKPHPEAFDKAFRSLGLPDSARAQVLAFEDNPRGVMSAKAAGLFTCAITTIHTREALAKQPVPPDFIADSFAEFRQWLGR